MADAVSPSGVNMEIYHGDALTFKMGQHMNRSYATEEWESDQLPNAHLIGNLPFSISSPLLFRLLLKVSDRNGAFACGRVPMTFLFQQEYAERMIAPPGFRQRSRLSVLSQAYCDVDIKFLIPSNSQSTLWFYNYNDSCLLSCVDTAFVPAPNVNAAVVSLIPLKKPRLKTKFDIVSRVVKALFQFKNKNWPVGI